MIPFAKVPGSRKFWIKWTFHWFNAHQQEIKLTLDQLGNIGDFLGGIAVLVTRNRIRLSMHLHSTFRIYEQAFLHVSRTNVDESYFTSSEKTKFELLGFPGVQRWWERSNNLFESRHSEFS
jgi:hypothetical protein